MDMREKPHKELLTHRTIWFFWVVLAYKIALDISYYCVISKIYSYARFNLHFNKTKLFEAYLLFFVVFILMPKSPKKLSNIVVCLLTLMSYIPMLTIFTLKDESRIFMYSVTAFWITVFQLLRLTVPPMTPLKHGKIVLYLVSACLGIAVLLLNYTYFGFSFNINLGKVYDIRRQYIAAKAPLVGYLFNWQAYIINPTFFAVFIRNKRRLLVGLVVILQLLLFSSTGNKTYLFAMPFVLILMWIIDRENALVYISAVLAGSILLGMLSYWLIDDIWISSLLARRTLFVPAHLYFLYYDFFSEHGPLFLSSTRGFRLFMDYAYELNPAHLIGQIYFNRPEMGANTGIVGDAYMNFGLMGLFLWSILLASILKLADACSEEKDLRVGIAVVAMPVLSLTNSALTTNLLTHGLFLALIVLYLLPKKAAPNEDYGKRCYHITPDLREVTEP